MKYRPPDFLKEELYMEHATRNFHAHGGNEWVVGGKLTFLPGATVEGAEGLFDIPSAAQPAIPYRAENCRPDGRQRTH